MENFSSKIENNSIGYRLSLIISHLNMTDGAFADSIGVDRAQFSKIKKDKLGLSVNVAMELNSKYSISLDWLYLSRGNMFISAGNTLSKISTVQELDTSYSVSNKTIPIVDISAAAGSGYYNPDYLTAEDVIQLPSHLSSKGVHICIRVKGDSMSPTLLDGGYLIIKYVDRRDWQDVKNEHIHVVSDTEGRAVVKRIKNRLEKGFIVLMSDNPDKAQYPNFNLQQDEINTIWHVEWYLSAKTPNIHATYYKRLQTLENRLDDLENFLKK